MSDDETTICAFVAGVPVRAVDPAPDGRVEQAQLDALHARLTKQQQALGMPAEEAGPTRADVVELVRQVFLECVTCGCGVHGLPSEPTHCTDCHLPEEDDEDIWRDAVQRLRHAIDLIERAQREGLPSR